eukprot:1271689-Heterocapsa_arctica.AAC.1
MRTAAARADYPPHRLQDPSALDAIPDGAGVGHDASRLAGQDGDADGLGSTPSDSDPDAATALR